MKVTQCQYKTRIRCIIFLVLCIHPIMVNDILVTTAEGTLRGVTERTHNGFIFFSFLDIPYAKAPVGNLKFKAPRPSEPWDGIREANQESRLCLSQNGSEIVGYFDCLYLNTYTPKLPLENDKTLRPVMVWIHGGGFIQGSKARIFNDPEYFMDKDVVVVVINYRLGALGFLSFRDPKLGISGNAGLKDQAMALKWVRRNIAAFGGDPNNVTLCGTSAGAASVSYQMLSPMSKGLFHNAIILSGVATCSWAEGHLDMAKELVKAMGKSTSTEAEMLAILENASGEELMDAQNKVPEVWKPNKHRYLGPTVETSTIEERFLPDTPKNILKSGNYNKVPVIIGLTSNEGLIANKLTTDTQQSLKPTTDAEYVPYWLNVAANEASELGKKIKQFYYNGETVNDTNKQCYFDYFSDTYFSYRIYDFAENLIQTSNHGVYLYNFDMVTSLNKFKELYKTQHYKGAAHSDDIFYYFKTTLSPKIDTKSQEYDAIQQITTWFTNFAKYSDPNGRDSNSLLNVQWQRATTNMEYLNISTELSVHSNFGKKVTDFWKTIETEHNQHPY